MEDNKSSVYEKLSKARRLFHQNHLTKTGRNDFQHYSYFELSDFLPKALEAFDEAGIVGIVTFGTDVAQLRIVDIKTGADIVIASPMSTAELKGCHPVQNLGAVQTYTRRYLWSAAMELIEGDPLDGSKPVENGQSAKVAPKPLPQRPQRESAASEKALRWQGHIAECKIHEGQSAKGPYKLFRVVLDDERTATTFDELIYKSCEAVDVEQEVTLLVAPNKRKAGTYELLGIETAQQELGDDQTWE